jgi:hypothetical protein
MRIAGWEAAERGKLIECPVIEDFKGDRKEIETVVTRVAFDLIPGSLEIWW